VGSVAIGSLLGSVADLADDEVIQEFLRKLGGSAGTIEDIFVATEVRFVAVAVAAAGVALLLRLVGAERVGLGEVVLTTPVSRTRWYAAHVALSLVLVTALMALFGLVLGVVGSAVTPLAPGLVGVAALLCGALPRVAPLVWGVLLVAFVVGELGTTMNLPSWVIDASPFAHLSQLPGGEFERVPAVWLTLIAAALIVAGWAAYRRRDAV
jgi:ABC-2 type transport system permease protein